MGAGEWRTGLDWTGGLRRMTAETDYERVNEYAPRHKPPPPSPSLAGIGGAGAVSGQPHRGRPGDGMGSPGADEQDRGMSNASSARRERYRQAARDAGFLLRLWPILLLAFLAVVPLIALGVGTAVIGVGVPVLVLGLSVSSHFAEIGRRAVAGVDSSEYIPGHYRRPEAGARGVRALLAPLRDPQRWADLTWVVVGFVVSLATWALAVAWIVVSLAAPFSPFVETIVQDALGDERANNLAELLGLEPDLLWATLIDMAVCVLFALTCPFVLRALVRAEQDFTRALLCRSGEVARLEASRAAVRRAEADARSRLERDIHDGPQQRLVRLGMDLARAKRQTSRDPRAAETILDGAIAQTRETLDELRGLSRGIAPPVLVDRGLGAALAEIAVRSGVPVAVDADVPRLSEHVEQAAYFVASEALANLNKHSGARAAELGAVVEDGALRLWVVDDGAGGASVDKGHGLAGLVHRLDGVDGRLSVVSPAGGPTRVEAVIPCGS